MNFKRLQQFLFAAVCMVNNAALYAQDDVSRKPVTVDIHGFVRADAAFDSRLNAESREGFFIFYPLKPNLDAEGNDLNKVANFNQWGMTTRLNLTATGPDIWGAKMRGYIEGDFTGPSNIENNAFRLRHGYIEMKWAQASLLAGQYWSPLDVPEMLPRVLALNTGAPFRSFTRSPLVKFEYFPGKLKFVFVAYSQRDYTSPGADGNSATYMRNAVIPNLHLMIQYTGSGLFAGAGIDYKQLRPRLVTDSLLKADEMVRSVSVHAFAHLKAGAFQLKTQAILGQNLSDHLMLGGYAVKEIDSNDHRTYINLNNLSVWTDLTYETGILRWGLFSAFGKNLGTASAAKSIFYGRGNQIDYVYRIAPRLEVNASALQFNIEAEYTAVAYGTPDEQYKVENSSVTGNIRLQAAVIYSF